MAKQRRAARRSRALLVEHLEGRRVLDGYGTLIVEDIGVDEDSGTAYFNVIFTGSFPGGFEVTYATGNDTAWAGTDYVAKSGTLYFEEPTEDETQTVYIDLVDLPLVEYTEQFWFELGTVTTYGPGTVAILDATAFCEISDDDEAVISVEVLPGSANEGPAGTPHNVTFRISMDHSVVSDVSVQFATTEAGSATAADGDFAAKSETVHLFNSAPSDVTVTINGDAKTELDELLFATIGNLQAGGLPVSFSSGEDHLTAWHTIKNDDQSVININVASLNVGEGAGTATISAELIGEVDHSVLVLMTTQAGTASSGGGDYAATAANLTFSGADQETKSYQVTINDDNVVEAAIESFSVTLAMLDAGGRNVIVGRASATVNIEDNDESQISINDFSAYEGTSPTGWTWFTFSLTLSKPVDTAITLDCFTVAVSAIGDVDYVHVNPPVTFTIPAMETSMVLVIYVAPDSADESNEIFKLMLANLVAPGRWVTIADGEGVGTIWDDDP